MLIQIHLRIAKVGLKSHFRDLQMNMDQQIAEIDRKNVQSRAMVFLDIHYRLLRYCNLVLTLWLLVEYL